MGRHKKPVEYIEKHLRIPKKLNDSIEEEAKRQKFTSFSEFTVHLLTNGLKKEFAKADKSETMRKISVKFKGKCLQCGDTIKVSQTCWWARDVGLMCLDCHQENELEGIGDITLARLYARKREMNKTNQGLKKIADELADKVNDLSQKINLYGLGERHEELETYKTEILHLIDDYLRKHLGTPQEKEALQRLADQSIKLEQLQDEIRKEIKERLLNPIPIKRKKKPTYVE